MKTMNCEHARMQLLDYIDRELDDPRREALDQHLINCLQCLEELHEIEHLHGTLQGERVPDPGATFWEEFPDQVWQAYRAERSAALRPNLGARIWEAMLARIRSFPAPLRWLPATATTVLMVGLALFYAIEPPSAPGIAAFQARIHQDPGSMLANSGVLDLPADQQYGFAAAPGTTRFFRIGHEYAQSLALAAGGDAASAGGHLAVIADSLGAVPGDLASLARGNPSRAQIEAIEPELGQIAAGAGTRDAALFRAGGWLANLALAIAARDAAALTEAAPEIARLQHDLERGGAVPSGVLRDLGTLAGTLAGNSLTERDYNRAARLIRDIQLVLI